MKPAPLKRRKKRNDFMKKKEDKELKLQKRLDLTDFSDPEDVERLNEDGLWALACSVSATCQVGWVFIDCYRDVKKPGVLHLLYERPPNG